METANVETPAATLNVVCTYCHDTNRVLRERLENAPRCGSCKAPLFEGHPAELDEAAFRRHVANSEIPVVADFWAPWCAPCRVMAPAFERAAREMEPHVRFVKVNTDTEQRLAAEHAIRGIPTLAIFKSGEEVARTAGAMDAARFMDWVRSNV